MVSGQNIPTWKFCTRCRHTIPGRLECRKVPLYAAMFSIEQKTEAQRNRIDELGHSFTGVKKGGYGA